MANSIKWGWQQPVPLTVLKPGQCHSSLGGFFYVPRGGQGTHDLHTFFSNTSCREALQPNHWGGKPHRKSWKEQAPGRVSCCLSLVQVHFQLRADSQTVFAYVSWNARSGITSSKLCVCPSCWCLCGCTREAAERLRTGEIHCRGNKKSRNILVRPAVSPVWTKYLPGTPSLAAGTLWATPDPLQLPPHPASEMLCSHPPIHPPTLPQTLILMYLHNQTLPAFKAQSTCCLCRKDSLTCSWAHTHTQAHRTNLSMKHSRQSA